MIKHIDMLFVDFPEAGKITKEAKEKNESRTFVGGVRINNGMYRTEEEAKEYLENSLKRMLP